MTSCLCCGLSLGSSVGMLLGSCFVVFGLGSERDYCSSSSAALHLVHVDPDPMLTPWHLSHVHPGGIVFVHVEHLLSSLLFLTLQSSHIQKPGMEEALDVVSSVFAGLG